MCRYSLGQRREGRGDGRDKLGVGGRGKLEVADRSLDNNDFDKAYESVEVFTVSRE